MNVIYYFYIICRLQSVICIKLIEFNFIKNENKKIPLFRAGFTNVYVIEFIFLLDSQLL